MDVNNGPDVHMLHIIIMFWDLLRYGRRSKKLHFPTNQLLPTNTLLPKLDFIIWSSRVVQ